MSILLSKCASTIAAFAITATGVVGLGTFAQADQRYAPRPAVEAPQSAQAAWLHQLKNSRRVNAAGVVFGGSLPHQPVRTAGNSIFSPDPFGQRRTVRGQRAQPGKVLVRPDYARPAPVRPQATRPVARRDVAPQRLPSSEFLPQRVPYDTRHAAGTIVIDTNARFLYHVGSNGMATRYGVGVGKPGFSWRGTHNITQKKKWPGWTPPKAMIVREKKKGRDLPAYMPGGADNPLGARALYLGSTLYRIHGTNQPWTIGQAVSSGCIRMRNQDVEALYEQVGVGTKVVVL